MIAARSNEWARKAVVRHQTAHGRFYEIEGIEEWLPSVTTVLGAIAKPALERWSQSQAQRLTEDVSADLALELGRCAPISRSAFIRTLQSRLREARKLERDDRSSAREIGTQLHALIDWAAKGRVGARPVATPAAECAFRSFESWAVSVRLEPVLSEHVVYSRRYSYAGTLDLVARVNGKLSLVDFKTSAALYPEYDLQATAYRVALREQRHIVRDALIVRLPKAENEAIEVHACAPIEDLWPVFAATLRVWQWLHGRVESMPVKNRTQSKGDHDDRQRSSEAP